MKIKTAYCYSSLLAVGLGLVCSPLLFGQGAVAKDPFVKQSAEEDGDPFADEGDRDSGDPFAGEDESGMDDPFAERPIKKPKVREILEPVFLVEHIQTELAVANDLLIEFGGREDASALRARLEKMLDAGEATLIETSFLRTTNGQRMKTESVREHIYPTEFEPPEVPVLFEGEGSEVPRTSVTPTAFDMRPVGMTVEIDAFLEEVDPGKGERYLSVNIAPEIIAHLGDRDIAPGSGAELRAVKQPEFGVMTLQTSVSIREGGTSLIGVVAPTPSEGKRVLVLVSADILKPGAPEERKETEREMQIRGKLVTHLEWIELGHRDANRLLRSEWVKRDAGDLRAALGEMMKAGDARLVETCYLKTMNGQRALVESIKEHIYPTEWEPSEISNELKVGGAEVRPTGASPSAFEARNVGTTVELEPSAGVDQIVSMRIAPEIVEYLGDRSPGEDCPPEVKHMVQPDFYTMKLQTQVMAFLGQDNLIGSFTPSGDPDKRVLLLMKVDVLR